ncbi:beta-propeller fold lactonase family protein, partial [Micrococcus luteus]|uniref:YncE family protein n=1 Tax=Micrococcus luteus TaxID=1270 RepID=UPI00342141E9
GSVSATDIDSATVTFSLGTGPAAGTVKVNADGSYTFTPTLTQRLIADTAAGAKTVTFVINASDGTANTPITVTATIDPARYVVVDSIGTAVNPIDVDATRSANGYVYSISRAGTLTVVDGFTGTVVKTVTVPGSLFAEHLAVDPAQQFAWVADGQGGRISRIDLNTGQVTTITVAGNPKDLVIVRQSGRALLYSTLNSGSSVAVRDADTGTLLRTIALPAGSAPTNITAGRDGRFLYVANLSQNSVTRIDTANNDQLTTYAVGASPQGLDVSADGRYVYVSSGASNSVSVIDTVEGKVTATVPVGFTSRDVMLSPDGALAFVTNQGNNTVTVVDTATNAVIGAPIGVGRAPQYIAIPATGDLYVGNYNDSSLTVLRPVSRNLNSAPVGVSNPAFGSPAVTDGAVTGTLNITDPDTGNTLSYTVV